MSPDIYLALVTIHGTIMVFFVLTAGLSGTFSNLLIPLQIGARDMASGFLNMIIVLVVLLIFCIDGCISLFVEAGPASAGWTIYPPFLHYLKQLEVLGRNDFMVSFYGNFHCILFIGSLNYIVTILNLRTKGMKMTRLPLTMWAFFITAIIGVVSFPVFLSAALLLSLIEVLEHPSSYRIFLLVEKCYTIKEDRQFYLNTYFGS